MPKVLKITDGRKKQINSRIKEYSIEEIKEVFVIASKSEFLNGINGKNWTASFDWLLNPTNFLKVLENNYKNIQKKQTPEQNFIKPQSDF